MIVSRGERATLEAIVRAPTSEQRAVRRARVVLCSAQGMAIERIADETGVAPMTVRLWRRRYAERGLAGLVDEPRPGRPPVYSHAQRERVIARTLEPPPEGLTHWSAARLAKEVGMSETTVWRIWQGAGLKPHRVETFKWSTDPALEAKVHDVVGLYLDPPDGAVVLSVDEKTQIQALDRTQPLLPMRPGQVERHTHDYTRHGTTCLFAALEVGSGRVTHQTRERHTGADFLAFLRRVRTCAHSETRLFLETPNILAPKVSFRRMFSPAHNFYFAPKTLTWLLTKAGWQEEKLRVFRRDAFQVLARPNVPQPPAVDPRVAGQVMGAIARHRYLYYLKLLFIWRKIPWWQQHWMYQTREPAR